MRHHMYNPGFVFVKEPEEFNKYTERDMLQYCLGATMYMPGTKDFGQPIMEKKYLGLTSMVMCFEDACKEEDVPAAEINSVRLLDFLSEEMEAGRLTYEALPLIFFRVRNPEQFRNFSAMLKPAHMRLITGFNFPKFNSENGEAYMSHLEGINQRFGEIVYGMPIIEDSRVAFK